MTALATTEDPLYVQIKQQPDLLAELNSKPARVTINGKRIYSKVQTTDNAVELAFTQRRAGTYTVTVRISGGLTFTERVSIR
jgi:hypothetical protein